jgi:hypothetical protein
MCWFCFTILFVILTFVGGSGSVILTAAVAAWILRLSVARGTRAGYLFAVLVSALSFSFLSGIAIGVGVWISVA